MKSQFKSYKADLRLGILGGGQLAQMLAQSAQRLGHKVHILCESKQEPACQVTPNWHSGSPNSQKDLETFFKCVDLVTFESEFYSTDVINQSLKKSRTTLFPSPQVMKRLQDRAHQKNLLDEYRIPTAEYVVIHSANDLIASFNMFKKMVLKKRIGGYDGYGTYILDSHKSLKEFLSSVDPLAFITPGFIAEKWIPFRQELAAIFVRTIKNEKTVLPLVCSHQKNSKCDWVLGPVLHPRWPAIQKRILRMLEEIDYVGCLGVEFFDLGPNSLLVNEIAPRVHNSGHYSMNALNFSQFDLHWHAGLGLKLPDIFQYQKAFVMTNLIGTRNTDKILFPTELSGNFHWYGKNSSRPGRKMGHINYIGSNSKHLLKLALQERKKFTL